MIIVEFPSIYISEWLFILHLTPVLQSVYTSLLTLARGELCTCNLDRIMKPCYEGVLSQHLHFSFLVKSR